MEVAMMTNYEKAHAFLSRIFNGADARLHGFAEELGKMFDQSEEEGKVRYMTELEEGEAAGPDDDDTEDPGDETDPGQDGPTPKPKKVFSAGPRPKKKR